MKQTTFIERSLAVAFIVMGGSLGGWCLTAQAQITPDGTLGGDSSEVKPGFVKTTMTAHLKPPPFAGEPEGVAERVLRAIDQGSPVVYAPGVWGPIMAVIRRLPRFVMRRAGF